MNTIAGNLGPDTERQQEYEMQIPNLAGIATSDLVEKIGGGSFSAAYINWSRTLHMLREHAPGWMPELVPASDGLLHRAPMGAYLLIRFRNGEQTTTAVPQAVMDQRNAAIPWDKITARDVTDTHRRGVCMAAAFTFGLAYELWAKLPLESGYHKDEPQEHPVDQPAPPSGSAREALKDAFDGLQPEVQNAVRTCAKHMTTAATPADSLNVFEMVAQGWPNEDYNEMKKAVWFLLDSKTRSAIKKHEKEAGEAPLAEAA